MVEPDAFTVGKDLATTPGKVVFRNRLVELIHYAPTTEKVRAMPIVIITPWINKFYILDLTGQEEHGQVPDRPGFLGLHHQLEEPGCRDMAEVRFDDYLLEGVNEVVRVASEFCKVPKVHLVGYCIGGTLVSTYMAWANKHFRQGQGAGRALDAVHDADRFCPSGRYRRLHRRGLHRRAGRIDGQEGLSRRQRNGQFLPHAALEPLIWHYWENSYLLGEPLPPFDVLFWNMDTTRMPQAMHSYYLREMYLNNNLIKRDKLTIAGEPIDLDRSSQPLYAVTAEDDHIAPWKQCYRIRKYVNVKAPVRFVLSTSGHILGIVNPPANPPKRAYWIGEPERNEHWEHWFDRAEKKARYLVGRLDALAGRTDRRTG
jgi:polyhydroxyalkanoate synthase